MTTLNHDPVALPPGSYDAAELQKRLEAATKAPADKRDEAVAKAFDAAAVKVEDNPAPAKADAAGGHTKG